ncbi:MAG: hypothetical protein U1E76_27020 [Planctomycetota bacterium]
MRRASQSISASTPWVTIPIKLNGAAGVPGAGFLDIPGSDVSSYPSLTVFVQVSLLDAGAVHGISLANGCQVVIGP